MTSDRAELVACPTTTSSFLHPHTTLIRLGVELGSGRLRRTGCTIRFGQWLQEAANCRKGALAAGRRQDQDDLGFDNLCVTFNVIFPF